MRASIYRVVKVKTSSTPHSKSNVFIISIRLLRGRNERRESQVMTCLRQRKTGCSIRTLISGPSALFKCSKQRNRTQPDVCNYARNKDHPNSQSNIQCSKNQKLCRFDIPTFMYSWGGYLYVGALLQGSDP